jgi:hypothetical protein
MRLLTGLINGSFAKPNLPVMKLVLTLYFNVLIALSFIALTPAEMVRGHYKVCVQKESTVQPQPLAIHNNEEVLHGQLLFR